LKRTRRSKSLAYCLLSFFAIVQTGFADDAKSHLSEKEVKVAAEYTATLGICSNSTLLELAKIESSSCENRLSNYSASCWKELDRLKLDYELAKDESSQEMFIAISLAYESCLRASLLYRIVHEQEKSDGGDVSEDLGQDE
jgi:hypothetical protein